MNLYILCPKGFFFFMQAEQWVKNMSKSSEDQSSNVLLKARPPRLVTGIPAPWFTLHIVMKSHLGLIPKRTLQL